MRQLISCFSVLLVWITPVYAADYFVDGTKHKVAYGSNAQRIVSLTPSVTEMLFFIGLGDRVVGRTNYCNFPPAVAKLPSVGGFVDTSLEKIVALKPDLVLAYQGNSLELVGQLRKLNVAVVAFPEASSLAAIAEQMEQLAKIVLSPGAPSKTVSELATSGRVFSWRKRLKEAQTHVSNAPAVFYGMPGEVTYTAGPGSFIDDLILRAGGRNAVSGTGQQRWPQVSAELILAVQPDWLLISTPCTGHTELSKASKDIRTSLANDPVWSKLKAVRNNNIVVINADVLLRPGPRILDALEQLHAALQMSEAQ